MSRSAIIAVGVIILALGLWMGFYPHDWQTWLGFTKASYFKTGQNYAFFSGFFPCFLTTLGLSTIIVGLFHHINCHSSGCWRIVRHKIANGEYGVCGRHWREINGHPKDHKFTIEHLRRHHKAHLAATGRSDG